MLVSINAKSVRHKATSQDDDKLHQIHQDLKFWNKELNKYQMPSHKPLKKCYKKYKPDILRKKVLEIINERKQDNISFITIEDTAYLLNAKKGDIKTIFMVLNREGVLSQAHRGLMHDSVRGVEPINPYERSDWVSNIYNILL